MAAPKIEAYKTSERGLYPKLLTPAQYNKLLPQEQRFYAPLIVAPAAIPKLRFGVGDRVEVLVDQASKANVAAGDRGTISGLFMDSGYTVLMDKLARPGAQDWCFRDADLKPVLQ